MKPLIRLIVFMAIGWVIGKAAGLQNLESEPWYVHVTTLLLAIGLYGSTYGIDTREAKTHWKLIVAAVTVGVIAKAAMIGAGMALLFQTPMLLVSGIVVAQIDPLAVAALMGQSRMSEKAKSILASWSSFDDPMTVLLGLYVSTLIIPPVSGAQPIAAGGIRGYAISLALNLAFAALVYVVWRFTKRGVANTVVLLVIGYALLSLSFATAVMAMLMLGLALIGLILRPPHMAKLLDWAVKVALAVATMLLGVLLLHGVNLWAGLALGVMAFAAQMIVARPLTRKLPSIDRKFLSLAQQNGITAIILALRLELCYPGIVAIVAPALVVVNTIHTLANARLERKLAVSQQ